ncbi:hypothetical protein N3K66_003339 [Trichothecium roseum]|uniref:Uncharacterized protein n=1 Tax=Trichothecium roseum TaxID=47278 RepID=A0ACC0V7R0_9HYPO|nr:hypothetical protein N3K66_003339 [Trichothecium roseum]
MWLDRLAGGPANPSGTSTPQPGSRSYSPLPRRTSSNLSPYVTSQRGQSPRGSTLSLVSNDSSSSLLSSSRRPNGSGLRQTSTIDQGPNSLELLGKILQAFPTGDEKPSFQDVIREDDLDLEPNFGGLSLKELSQLEKGEDTNGVAPRSQSIEEFEQQKGRLEDLHRSINACDDVLNSVETNLANFRSDLATVSADIETLQSRSTALNRRLENRQRVEKAIAPLVEELSVSPETVLKISEGHIDEAWTKALGEVDRRAAAHKKRATSRPSRAAEDLGPLLEKLTAKAIERIRDFLVTQIKALRSPNINAQIIQQHNFLKFKELFTFLHKHHSTLADEISQAYINTMRWYYLNQFTRYERALAKIKLHTLDKNDVLGQEDAAKKATVLTASRVGGPPHDAFNLGRRIDMIKTKNQSALSSYLAEEDQSTHYLEAPFRNFNLALADNATAEYTFLTAFFAPSFSYSRIGRTFDYIFEPIFELGKTLTKNLVSDTFDALGILLCIRLNQHFAFELQRRKIPAMDSYINGSNMLLWPRLQIIIDRHCESVKQLTNTIPSKPSSEIAKMSAAPHVATQRFGQLLHGFLALSPDAGDDEPLVTSLTRLRAEVEMFLIRQSQVFGGGDKRKGGRFLYNNYSLILTIISDATGRVALEQQRHFEELKASYQEVS